jgi:hypothetical protein
MRVILAGAALVLLGGTTARAGVETVAVRILAPVKSIVGTGSGVYVQAGGKYYKLGPCGRDVCLVPGRPARSRRGAPAGALPDGKVASALNGDIRQAWYAKPTTRYEHGILGDRIEGRSLVAVSRSGKRFEFVLEKTHVFEDLAPRIADLDGDGINEIVTIRSSLTKGSSVAVYGLREGKLKLLAHSREIGRTHRWLNIAGIARFFGSAIPVIAWVETPHIGGTLHFARFENGKLIQMRAQQSGFSNHFIGSRELGMSAVADFDGDGTLDLFVPSADRKSLRLVTRSGNRDFKLPGVVATALAPFDGGVVAATSDGNLYLVRP